MLVVVQTDQKFAPGSYILCRLESTDDTPDIRDDDNTILYDSDWNFPSLASMLGWGFDDEFGGDDADHREIMSAIEWLDEHRGEVLDIDDDAVVFNAPGA